MTGDQNILQINLNFVPSDLLLFMSLVCEEFFFSFTLHSVENIPSLKLVS